MAVNEQIVTGRKFRKLIDEANKLWQRISFWTKASDVEFNDGKNAETKFGAINGVTDSLTSTASNIAASAKAVKTLNDKVTQLSSNIATKISFVLKLHYSRTVESVGVETVTDEAQLNDIDVSNYKKITVSNIVKSGEYNRAFLSVHVNGTAYNADQIIDITSLKTISIKCRYHRGGVASAAENHTASVKITLSN